MSGGQLGSSQVPVKQSCIIGTISNSECREQVTIHLLCEAGKLGTVDCESPEYIEMIWQMLLANPEAIMA